MSHPSVAIPGMIVEFLERRASVGVAGTRDRRLRPRVHSLSGWIVADAAMGELVCLVSRGFTDGLLSSLEENGEFAAAIEYIGTHETYQFKGSFAGWRPAGDADRDAWERSRGRFAADVKKIDPRLGVSDDWLKDYIAPPEMAVRLRVREIFTQTPGPGAGRRLVPPEAP